MHEGQLRAHGVVVPVARADGEHAVVVRMGDREGGRVVRCQVARRAEEGLQPRRVGRPGRELGGQLVGPAHHQALRRAVPVEVAEDHLAVQPLRRGQLDAQLIDRKAVAVRHLPRQPVGARLQRDDLAVAGVQRAVAAIMPDKKAPARLRPGAALDQRLDRLRAVQGRAGQHLEVAGVAHAARLGSEAGLHAQPPATARRQPPVGDPQPAAGVAQPGDRLQVVRLAVDLEALHGAGILEAEARLPRRLLLAAQCGRRAQDPPRLQHGVGHALAAVGADRVQPVGHRRAQVHPRRQRRQPEPHAVQAADVAGVAVRVPARARRDGQAALEVGAAHQQRHQHRQVVGHHRAVAGVAVVAVLALDPVAHLAPVPGRRTAVAHRRHQPAQHRVPDESQPLLQQAPGVRLLEGQRLQHRQELRAVDGDAVVADAGGLARQPRGARRRSGIGQRPPVGEDLRANLLRHRAAVQGDRTAGRRRVSLPQPQPGGVLGGAAHAAPPQDGLVLDDVVEPGLADLARAQGRIVTVVLQRPEENERARQVVVRHDQRHAHLVVDEVGDLAETFPDRRVAPALHRAPQVDADQLAEHAGVDTLADLPAQPGHDGVPYPLRAPEISPSMK